VKYEAKDKVSTIIDGSLFSLVWQCFSDEHLSRFCQQFAPGDESKLGWTLIGHCDGTMAPTTAPNFAELTELEGGCPEEYETDLHYESGDVVSYSMALDRTVVYQCKEWPNDAYCNAGSLYAPGNTHSSLAWELIGWCSGTLSPTSSPMELTALCPEEVWSSSNLFSYKEGTRVRKSASIFECRSWPNSLWCTNSAYEPENTQHWEEAWTYVGECPTFEEVTATIEGALTITTETSQSLSESEITELVASAEYALQDIACACYLMTISALLML